MITKSLYWFGYVIPILPPIFFLACIACAVFGVQLPPLKYGVFGAAVVILLFVLWIVAAMLETRHAEQP